MDYADYLPNRTFFIFLLCFQDLRDSFIYKHRWKAKENVKIITYIDNVFKSLCDVCCTCTGQLFLMTFSGEILECHLGIVVSKCIPKNKSCLLLIKLVD